MLHIPRELLDNICHVTDLLLELLDLVLELLGLLHGRVDFLAAQSGYRVVQLAEGKQNVQKELKYRIERKT